MDRYVDVAVSKYGWADDGDDGDGDDGDDDGDHMGGYNRVEVLR